METRDEKATKVVNRWRSVFCYVDHIHVWHGWDSEPRTYKMPAGRHEWLRRILEEMGGEMEQGVVGGRYCWYWHRWDWSEIGEV